MGGSNKMIHKIVFWLLTVHKLSQLAGAVKLTWDHPDSLYSFASRRPLSERCARRRRRFSHSRRPTIFSVHDQAHRSGSTQWTDNMEPIVTLRGGGVDVDANALASEAYDWCTNLGAPAALIAGAVIATLYENIRGGQLELHKGDSKYVMGVKKLTNLLLLSAFALQIICIFVTTVTGTMIKSRDFSSVTTTAHSALGFLKEQFEFEYLTCRLSFLQGLLHWLAGVALEHTIPRRGEGIAAKKMDHFVAVSLGTLIVLLLSFYNTHLTAYNNYWDMLVQWGKVTTVKYAGELRPMMLLFIPGLLSSLYVGILALKEGSYSEERDD